MIASIQIASIVLQVLSSAAAKAAGVLVIAMLLTACMRRGSAATRHLILTLALAIALLLPIAGALAPSWKLAVLPPPKAAVLSMDTATPASKIVSPEVEMPSFVQAVQSTDPLPITRESISQQESLAAQDFTSPPPVAKAITRPKLDWPTFIVATWLAGTVIITINWIIGVVAAFRLARSAHAITAGSLFDATRSLGHELGIRRHVSVRIGGRVTMPLTSGIVQPMLLLPADAPTWPTHQLRAVLLHELAHVKRHDCATQLLAQMACAVYWFNPLAWLAAAKLRAERERACDDAVLLEGADPVGYADLLLAIASTLRRRGLADSTAIAMARRSGLRDRVTKVLSAAVNRRPVNRSIRTVAMLLALFVLLPLAAVRLANRSALAQTPADPPAAQPPLRTGVAATQPAANDLYTPTVADSKPTSDITGIVKDESGSPLANIKVLAVCGWKDGGERRTVQTDSSGHFTFPVLKPGGWFFSVNDSHYGWEWDRERWQTVPAKPEDLPVAITLYKTRTLRGTVVDEAGKPVAGVRVVLVNQSLPGSDRPISGHIDIDFLVVKTDQVGRFTMQRLRPGKAVFALEQPDYSSTLVKADVTDKETALTIQKGMTLRGRVKHSGVPVPGVEVRIGMAEGHRLIVDWQGKTNSNGEFEAPRIWSGFDTIPVILHDDAWYSDLYNVHQTSDRELPEVTIEAKPIEPGKAPESGSVDVGKPVPADAVAGQGGVVNVSVPGALSNASTIFIASLEKGAKPIDPERQMQRVNHGTARFEDLPPGRYRFSVFGGADDGPGRPPKDIELAAGQTLNVTLEPAAGNIRGTVRSGGKAVGGGDISWFISPQPPGAVFQGGVQVQHDGSYSITGLVQGTYRLMYEAPNSMLYQAAVALNKDSDTFDINLPTGRIEGTLVGAAPKPKDPEIPLPGDITIYPRGEPRLPSHAGCWAQTDSSGHFTIEHLPPNLYTIQGYGFRTSVLIDKEGAVVKASLGPPEKTGEIAGKITGHIPVAAGDDTNKVQVSAFPKDQFGYDLASWTYSTQVNPKTGEYRIRNVPAGTYAVYAAGTGFGAARAPFVFLPDIEVREGLARQLPIEIPEGREVAISTRVAGHPELECQTWRLRTPAGEWLDEAVSFNSEWGGDYSLALGDYTLEADYGDHGRITQKFTVERGEETQAITIKAPAQPMKAAPATQPRPALDSATTQAANKHARSMPGDFVSTTPPSQSPNTTATLFDGNATPANSKVDLVAAALIREVRQSERWINKVDSFRMRVQDRTVILKDGKEQSSGHEDITELGFDQRRMYIHVESPQDQRVAYERSWDGKRVLCYERYSKPNNWGVYGGKTFVGTEHYAFLKDLDKDMANLFFSYTAWPQISAEWVLVDPPYAHDPDYIYGRPEDYHITGQITFHGVRCLVIDSNSLLYTFYVGLGDHHPYGMVERVIPRAVLPQVYDIEVQVARDFGATVENASQASAWMDALPVDRRQAADAEKWRRAGPLARPLATFWYEDYKEFGAGCWVPMRQGYDQGVIDDKPAGDTTPRHDSRVIDVAINQPLPEEWFAAKIKEGTPVDDWANVPWLSYIYKEHFTPQEWQVILDEGNKREAQRTAHDATNRSMVGHQQIDFPDNWVQGQPMKLADLKGKVTIVEFWATWCGPCRNDVAALNQLAATAGGNGITILSVHAAGTSPEDVKAAITAEKITYPVCIDQPLTSNVREGRVFNYDHVTELPSAIVIDRDGKIAAEGSLAQVLIVANQLATQPATQPEAAGLNEDQNLVLEWTNGQFRSYFDARSFAGWSDQEKANLETRSIDALKGPQDRDYYQAINTLAALKSTKALPALRDIAFDRHDKNNRDRWMAIRALGLMGDKSAVPQLIHLVYHGNTNTHWWAQISLVRLTGQNFGSDWQAWGKWWNQSGGQPAFDPQIIRWWNGQPDADKLAQTLEESDRKFLDQLRSEGVGNPPATRPAPKP